MRVLILANSYPPVLGGLQTVAHTLAQQLLQAGHGVQIVPQRYPRSLPELGQAGQRRFWQNIQ